MDIKTFLKTGSIRLGKLSMRVLIFIGSTVALWFAIVLLDRIAIPLLTDIPSDEYSRQISTPAVLVFAWLVNILFMKIIMRKTAQTLVIILAIYLALLALDFLLAISGFGALPGPFWDACIIGLIGYFVLKPFKKSMVSKKEEAHEI